MHSKCFPRREGARSPSLPMCRQPWAHRHPGRRAAGVGLPRVAGALAEVQLALAFTFSDSLSSWDTQKILRKRIKANAR